MKEQFDEDTKKHIINIDSQDDFNLEVMRKIYALENTLVINDSVRQVEAALIISLLATHPKPDYVEELWRGSLKSMIVKFIDEKTDDERFKGLKDVIYEQVGESINFYEKTLRYLMENMKGKD